jgi:putative transposase
MKPNDPNPRDRGGRRSIRIQGYDYSQPGAYYVTICTHGREGLFGDVTDGQMILNPFGKTVDFQWRQMPRFFQGAGLDEFTFMPDHMHGIVMIFESNVEGGVRPDECGDDAYRSMESGLYRGEASRYTGPQRIESTLPRMLRPYGSHENEHPIRPTGTKPGSLSAMIQNFISVSTRKINRIRRTPGSKVWQRNYWEHVIRDENELERIREYIRNNPLRWEEGENDGGWPSAVCRNL